MRGWGAAPVALIVVVLVAAVWGARQGWEAPFELDADLRSGGGAGSGPAEAPQVVVRCFRAKEGGTLSVDQATLHVPLGALAKSECLRLAVDEKNAKWHLWPYQIEPANVVFDPPAIFEIDTTELTSMAPWLVPTKSSHPNLGPSELDGNTLRFDVHRSGPVVAGTVASGMPDGCAVRPERFEACGGKLEGNWRLEGLCYDRPRSIFYEEPERVPSSTCIFQGSGRLPAGMPANLQSQNAYEWPMSATLIVTNTHWLRTEARSRVPLITRISARCDPHGTCEALSRAFFGRADHCVGATMCDCRPSMPPSLPSIDASFSASHGRLSIAGARADGYCVSGKRLRVRVEVGGEQALEVYRRQ